MSTTTKEIVHVAVVFVIALGAQLALLPGAVTWKLLVAAIVAAARAVLPQVVPQ